MLERMSDDLVTQEWKSLFRNEEIYTQGPSRYYDVTVWPTLCNVNYKDIRITYEK
jgi:hypothetical protein